MQRRAGEAPAGPCGPAEAAPVGRARRRLLVALVVPEPAATEIDGLRRALSSRSLGRIAPHLTLVPPRNVAAAELDAVLAHLRGAAAGVSLLRLVLGPPATFAPRTPVVFLSVGGEPGQTAQLAVLASRLQSGPLAAPPERPAREFVPHVTLCGDAGETRATTIVSALAGYRQVVELEKVMLLEQQESAPRRPWLPLAEVMLGRPAVVGRGGVELELAVTSRLDPTEQAFFDTEWLAYSEQMWGPGFVPDEPLAVVARRGDQVVAVATGSVRPEMLHLQRLVVGRAVRGEGIGGQVMRGLERLARERGCQALRLETADGGPAQRFYAALGYTSVAVLPRHRAGRDFAVMERRLAGNVVDAR